MALRIELKTGERILIGECVITNSDQRATLCRSTAARRSCARKTS